MADAPDAGVDGVGTGEELAAHARTGTVCTDDQVTHGPLPVREDRRDAPVGLARVPDELGAEAQLAAEAGEQ